MDMQLFTYVGVVALLMLSNTLFKVASCNMTNSFDKELFWKGIKKYVFILAGVGSIMVAGMLIPDMSVISIGGNQITILTMLNMVSLSLIVTYALRSYENLKEVFSLSPEEVEKYLPNINDEEEKG